MEPQSDAHAGYPQFKEFVNFLSKEADLACDPISSVQALRSVESDKTFTKPNHSSKDTVHKRGTKHNFIMHLL